MNHSPDVECITAARIVNEAMVAAIDEAIEANVPSACLAAAILNHICSVLFDVFGQSVDDIAMLARTSAATYVARQAGPSKHHH